MDLRRAARRSGVSFIELLMVIAIVAAVTGVGTMYYRGLMDQGSEERARIDMRTLKKAILKLETDEKVVIRPDGPHPEMEPEGLGVNEGDAEHGPGFHIDRLLDFRLMTSIPYDPWGQPYQIDIKGGELYSMGPDMQPITGDDITLQLKPPFEVIRATLDEDQKGIVVEFNRKVDPYSLYVPPGEPLSLPFQLSVDAGVPAPGSPMTTAARVMTNPYGVVIRLQDPLLPPTPGNKHFITVWSGSTRTQVRAMDTAEVENSDLLIPIDVF